MRYNSRKLQQSQRRITQLLLLWLGLSTTLGCLNFAGVAQAEDIPVEALNSFQNLWERNDRPVAQGAIRRTWTWGPAAFKTLTEPYTDTTPRQRSVAYYDKSRMEINNPTAVENSQWYVTNGLLVREMVSGQIQTGTATFSASNPAQIAVAGDPLEFNPGAPTYATFKAFASLNNDHRVSAQPGNFVTTRLDAVGQSSNDSSLASYNVHYSYYDQTLGHNIPDVFINFFKTTGIIYQDGAYRTGLLLDWVFACGLPLTEPFWIQTKVGGKDSTVLVQLFERRVLTYNPTNAVEWQVEMGNVGQHYYTWRYSSLTLPPTTTPGPVPATPPLVDSNPAFGSVEQLDGQDVLAIGNGSIKRTVVMGKPTVSIPPAF